MKFPHSLILAAFVTATTAFGQLVAVGGKTGVVTLFDAEITGQNLYITVDNTHPAAGVIGAVTSFGFNTPWTAALDLSKVALSYQVLSATGPTAAWNKLSTFELTAGLGGGGVTVDLGLESDHNGNPNGNSVLNGVEPGEIVKFLFAFDQPTYAMPTSDNAEFFNQETDARNFLVRWQNISGTTAGNSDAFAGSWPTDDFNPDGPEVPEPSTYGLLGAAGLLVAVAVRRMRR